MQLLLQDHMSAIQVQDLNLPCHVLHLQHSTALAAALLAGMVSAHLAADALKG
jgi:hypothetical protein